jgi:phage/plasmid-like protein (TIGR03299 family)
MTTALAPGEATAAPGRIDALHVLGTDVRDTGSAHNALAKAGVAGLNVRKVPLQNSRGEIARGKFGLEDATGRLIPHITVGSSFEVVQFEDNADLLDSVAERTGAVLDAAGAIDTRSYGLEKTCAARAFLSLSLPEPIMIGGDDPMQAYILALMSHGGASNFLLPTATRVFCANQQNQVTQGITHKIVIRHTSSAKERTALAEDTLVTAVKAMQEMAKDAEKLRTQKVTNEQFSRIVETIYPLNSDSKAAATRHDRRLAALEAIWTGPTNANIGGTAWGAYQAVTEYDEWVRSVRGGENGDPTDKARARRALSSNLSANSSQFKAYQVIKDMVGLSN